MWNRGSCHDFVKGLRQKRSWARSRFNIWFTFRFLAGQSQQAVKWREYMCLEMDSGVWFLKNMTKDITQAQKFNLTSLVFIKDKKKTQLCVPWIPLWFRHDITLCDLLVGLYSVSIGSVYFSLACGQTADRLTTSDLDQLKRLMRPVLIMSAGGGGTETGSIKITKKVEGDDILLAGRWSHDASTDESIFCSKATRFRNLLCHPSGSLRCFKVVYGYSPIFPFS